jgi:hypothetical protein
MAEYLTHKMCDHPNTKLERWKCRARKRHSGCDHKQSISQWRRCEETARRKAKEK